MLLMAEEDIASSCSFHCVAHLHDFIEKQKEETKQCVYNNK